MSRVDRALVFAALGDPMRLLLLARIGEGRSITQLAADLPVTRQAVTRHLRVLERAKLLEVRRLGREARFVARPARLAQASRWLDEAAQQWGGTLGRLKVLVEEGADESAVKSNSPRDR